MSVVLFERRGSVALITLNRPEARNAVNPELAVRLAGAWEEVKGDPEIRAAVVTGAGDKSFCAGADLARLIPLFTGARAPEDEWDEALRKDPSISERALLREFDPEKPIIAAVTGFCIAGGMELLQATDVRVAAEDSKFGLQEPKWGLFPISGSTVRLPRQIPYAVAMEILLTGDLIDAARAYDIGLVNRVVPRGEVLKTALAIAQSVAENGPIAVRAIRRSVRATLGLPEKDALALEREFGMPVFQTDDAREGPRAFKEKRKPRFTGT
ncbi:MAG TPA: crotonase/enoyl-CoA hydratase family protein [Myxococcota bacterium]|nr:crotonase/enoyl-CoA hydratase family protein [Myxococcota bacterium]